MKYEEFKSAVIAAAESLGVAEYELYYAAGESASVSAFGHEVKSISSSTEGGVSFRCLSDGRMGYAATEELSEAEAKSLVARALDNASAIEAGDKELFGEGGREYAKIDKAPLPFPDMAELTAAALRGQEELYKSDPAVIDGCESEADAFTSTVAIYNTRGLDLKRENTVGLFFSQSVVSENGELADAFKAVTGDIARMDVPAIAAEATRSARAKLRAEVAPTGSYPVVFSPKAMASLLSTFSGIFSLENARKGLSRLMDKEGELVASEAVTLTDDPFRGSSPAEFDAEGTPTYRKTVIEKGRLMLLLSNLKTAAACGRESTGNGAKPSYDAPVGIRPFAMYLEPGDKSEEELISGIDHGVYIDFLGGLHAGADPISGDFSLQSGGFMIEGGKKTTPVKSFTVAGSFYGLLKNIEALSNNCELTDYGSETVFGSPAVLANGLTIAGR